MIRNVTIFLKIILGMKFIFEISILIIILISTCPRLSDQKDYDGANLLGKQK